VLLQFEFIRSRPIFFGTFIAVTVACLVFLIRHLSLSFQMLIVFISISLRPHFSCHVPLPHLSHLHFFQLFLIALPLGISIWLLTQI
jgi:hypothetical protein